MTAPRVKKQRKIMPKLRWENIPDSENRLGTRDRQTSQKICRPLLGTVIADNKLEAGCLN